MKQNITPDSIQLSRRRVVKSVLDVWGRLMRKSVRFKKRDLLKLAKLLSTGQQMTKALEWDIKTGKLRSFYKFSVVYSHISHMELLQLE